MEEYSTSSPIPQKVSKVEPAQFTFPEAIKEVIDGKKITRIEWHDENIFGVLANGLLMIHISNEFKAWTINDGDLLAEDWIVIGESN